MLDILSLYRLVDRLHPEREATGDGDDHHDVEHDADPAVRREGVDDVLGHTWDE